MKNTKLSLILLLLVGLIAGTSQVDAAFLLQEEPSEQQQSENNDSESGDEEEEAEDGPAMPVTEQPKTTSRSRRSFSKRSADFLSAFSSVVDDTSSAVVEVANGKRRIALGTVVDAEQGFILTKASELKGDLKCRFSDGTEIKPTIYGVDPETDLVLLKVEKEGLNAIEIAADANVPEVGSWLATVNQKSVPLAVGIVSHEPRLIRRNTANSAYIGIFPRDRTDGGEGVLIDQVNADTPANDAGLLANDIIVSIDDDSIKNRGDLFESLAKYSPGDEITVSLLRDDEKIDLQVTLGINPNSGARRTRGNSQDRRGSRLSDRRADFPLAVQHDTALNANDCGGPLVDLSGRIVGINIARDGRVSSLALPNQVVLPILAELMTGKLQPLVVNEKEIVSVETLLAEYEEQLTELPGKIMENELDFRASAAVEEELQRQIKEVEKQLKKLQTRLDEKKEKNIELSKSLRDLKGQENRAKRQTNSLGSKLKMLKTGVK